MVDLLVDLLVDISVDFLVHTSVDWIPEGMSACQLDACLTWSSPHGSLLLCRQHSLTSIVDWQHGSVDCWWSRSVCLFADRRLVQSPWSLDYGRLRLCLSLRWSWLTCLTISPDILISWVSLFISSLTLNSGHKFSRWTYHRPDARCAHWFFWYYYPYSVGALITAERLCC